MINDFSPGSDFPESPALTKKSPLSGLFSLRTLVLATTVLVILHSVLLLFVGLERFTKDIPDGTEVGLGTFRFQGSTDGATHTLIVEFDLHVGLLDKCDRLGRHLLRNHKHRVQQGVEELLREAAVEDFHDPRFADLRRQFQETINDVLGERVVAEVIMTRVSVEQGDARAARESEQDPAALEGGEMETVWAPAGDSAPVLAPIVPNPSGDNVSLPSVQ